MGNTGFTGSSATDGGVSTSSGATCPHCGKALPTRGLEQFLGKLGINEEMIDNLRSSMQNVDVEEYLDTAREYLRSGSDKARSYAKENPGKVAAGVAVLAVGAGLLISALNRD
jgi:hypothetical protein